MIERSVESKEYMSVLRELAEEGKVIFIRVIGRSMSPFLCHDRDYIYFTKPGRELRRGDMVFYQRDNGQYVMHRIVRVRKDGYYMAGDAQTQIEGPLRRDQIFALITQVKRKDRILQPGDFWWEFFEHVWIRILPLRRGAANCYSRYCRIINKWKHEEKE